ncbi:fizzy-related protein homolog [Macrosteles quadrilineatus]|nr:fizzy-related protein homolog [Macrosteles quadrilineatus]
MDTDCEMDRQFAKRLRRQQMCSPKSIVLRESANTTPTTPTQTIITDSEQMNCEEDTIKYTETVEMTVRKSHVQRWLFPPTDDTPPCRQEEKQNELDTENNPIEYPITPSPTISPCVTPQKVHILEERLRTPVIVPPPLFKMSNKNSVNVSADRYIPARSPHNWHTRFSMIPDGRSMNCSSKKSRDTTAGEGGRDSLAYNCLLRNELLGANIGAVKGPCDERRAVSSPERNNFFHYSSPIENEQNIESVAPYSLSPVGPPSQKLLRSPRKATRKISRIPFKVLDAPELQDDFYLNLVDWSSQNVLSVGLGSCVYLWSACTSQVTRLCDLSSDNNSVTSVAWSERGNYLAVGTHNGYVQVWDVSVSKQMNVLNGHSARVGALAWNGDMLSSGSRDRMILQRDVRVPAQTSGDRRLVGHRQEICGLKWSPDNQYLASGGNDNRLYVWNMHSLTPMQTYTEHLAAVKAIAWSPHHHGLLASGGGTADRCIRFWNTLTGQPMQCIDTGSQVCNLAWSKHSSELVSTHGYSQNQILVWKYPALTQVAKLTGHSYRVLYLAVSPDGEAIVTGAGDETLRFWNVFSKVRSQKESKSMLNLFTNIR